MNKVRILTNEELTTLKRSFGDRVRHFRKLANLSQEELGFESGLHRTYIGSIERGETNLSLENIAIIAISLRYKISDLFPCLNGIRKNTK